MSSVEEFEMLGKKDIEKQLLVKEKKIKKKRSRIDDDIEWEAPYHRSKWYYDRWYESEELIDKYKNWEPVGWCEKMQYKWLGYRLNLQQYYWSPAPDARTYKMTPLVFEEWHAQYIDKYRNYKQQQQVGQNPNKMKTITLKTILIHDSDSHCLLTLFTDFVAILFVKY